MGLLINVYRAGTGDTTNGGISSKATRLCLVSADGPFEPSDAHPPVILDFNTTFGKDDPLPYIVPAIRQDDRWIKIPRWTMFGGNYAAASDDRYNAAILKLTGRYFTGAVPIHDRIEA